MPLNLTLDHVVIAVRELEAATRDYEMLFGRTASWRGEHPKYGTKNTLFRIENTYVELLATGDAKAKDKRWREQLSRHLDDRGEGVYALAIGTDDVKMTARRMRDNGLDVADPQDGNGVDLISAARRSWRNALVDTKTTNGARIFFIEHISPADALPVAAITAGKDAVVRRMDHAVVLSADMEAARRVWDDQIGARLALDRTFPDRNTRILFFRLGDITIEISGGASQSREGEGKPDRIWGLAWGVDSIEATCARLNDAGIETSGPRPGIKPGTIIATVKGPQAHGVATLLIEHTAESFRPESREPHGMAYDNAPATADTPQSRAFHAVALDHVVFATADLDATAAKWDGALGLPVTETATIDARGARPGFRMAKLPAGNAFVELIAPLESPTSNTQPPAQGMFSMSIEVDDIDAAVRDLRAKGVLVSDPAPGAWPGTRTAQVNKQAASGVPLQLLQRS